MSMDNTEVVIVPDPPTTVGVARAESDRDLAADLLSLVSDNWHEGRLGRVVGRCTDRGYPAMIVQTDDGLYRVRVERLRG